MAALAPVLALLAGAVALLLLLDLLARGLRRRRPSAVAAVGSAAVAWRRRPVLNRSEALVLGAAEAAAARLDPAWRVWPQVALGEALAASGPDGAGRSTFLRINAKRCDLLLVDGGGWPLAAIEYQGEGHFQGDWRERDATKRIALERAGVLVVEVAAPLARRPDALRRLFAEALAPLAAAEGSRPGAGTAPPGAANRGGWPRGAVRSARR